MITIYIAHYDHKYNRTHYLNDHINDMREFIQSFALSFDAYNMTESSAILHDAGKKSERFQSYVQDPAGKRGMIEHAKGGAYALSQMTSGLNGEKRYLGALVQLVVAGHHAGLANFDKNFFDNLNNLPPELKGIEKLAENEVKDVFSLLDETELNSMVERVGETRLNLYVSVLVRFVMSGLADADYLSTEAFFSSEKAALRQYHAPGFSYFQELFDAYITDEFSVQQENGLDLLKNQVQDQAWQAGGQNHTFFTLHAPTGTGKTIAALKFALNHTCKHHKKRIITALPLTNLTEEVSTIYRDIFGSDHVIEDHSSASFPENDSGAMRLAAENWNRPFIVTTTVQLFESLFHHHPVKLRKLHRLADSVIILDEYHKLPYHVLEPILEHLDILQRAFNMTVLFMSATPFPFNSKKINDMSLLNDPADITDYKQLVQSVPDRVRYEWHSDLTVFHDVARTLAKESSVLAIVNTRKVAQQLHEILEGQNHPFEMVYHVSTTMCSRHRERILKEIKRKRDPADPRPIAVIATSVLEAGIDISFPVVYRMLAPLDSIIQAAGRCNRYGETGIGRVVLFGNPQNASSDNLFYTGTNQTKKLLKEKGESHFTEPDALKTYFKRVLDRSNLNTFGITSATSLCFRDISFNFKMIEDERLSVICPDADGFQTEWLYEDKSPSWWRKVQPFTVAVPVNAKNYKDIDGLKIWTGSYDETYGILL